MDREQAAELSNIAAEYYVQHERFGTRQAEVANTAIHHQLIQFVPDDSAAAVVEHEDGLPLILAADDERVYVVDVVEVEPDAPATARCRLFPLNDRCRIGIEARFRGAEVRGIIRVGTWTLKIDDFRLSIPARLPDGGADAERREAVARRIASALGWRFPAEG